MAKLVIDRKNDDTLIIKNPTKVRPLAGCLRFLTENGILNYIPWSEIKEVRYFDDGD